MNWLRRMMLGRYGVDQFSIALLVFSVVLSLLQGFFHAAMIRTLFFVLSFACMALCYFRILSRNHEKRRLENQKFVYWWSPVYQWLRGRKGAFEELQTYKHFKCPQCGKKVRIPRGKGRIAITCPGCHISFIKKT